MARLYLWAEGQTEQTFADDVLKEHLAQWDVFLSRPLLIAHAKKKGKIHRGGGRKYLPMRNDMVRLISQEKSSDVFFTTMIDLYAIHADFPGRDEAEALRHVPEKRVEFLEDVFARDIGDVRFLPYIQLHEFEAILFSDPTCLRCRFDHHEKQIAALKIVADSKKSPELIDDGQHTAPSKRIIAELPDYETAKPIVGPQAAKRLGLDIIRSKCPHFAAWLTRLEALGGGPAPTR